MLAIKSSADFGGGVLYIPYWLLMLPIGIVASIVAHYRNVFETKTIGDLLHETTTGAILKTLFVWLALFVAMVTVAIIAIGAVALLFQGLIWLF